MACIQSSLSKYTRYPVRIMFVDNKLCPTNNHRYVRELFPIQQTNKQCIQQNVDYLSPAMEWFTPPVCSYVVKQFSSNCTISESNLLYILSMRVPNDFALCNCSLLILRVNCSNIPQTHNWRAQNTVCFTSQKLK